MKCPKCTSLPSNVLKTEQPIDEGLEYGDVKRRLRKCRECGRNFKTFEVHESIYRVLFPKNGPTESKTPKTPEARKLSRQPLTFGSKDRRPK